MNEKIKLFPLDVMFSWDSIKCDEQHNMFLDMMEPQNNYPPVIDRNTIMAQHFIRKWDASFRSTGNKNVGFDMKETPFDSTKFDMYNFGGNAYETVNFEYIFDGLVFYEPLNVKKVDKIDILGIDNDRYNLSDYNCQINKWMTR